MNFKPENEEKTFIEQQLDTNPCINIIDQKNFGERVYEVFDILYKTLSKSFGPGGASTFISVYPALFNTKDGFTIMKNAAFDKKLDQVISDMMMTICSRLNFTVGDGTTTAVIATHEMYESFRHSNLQSKFYLPRTIIERLEVIKNAILKEIDLNTTQIPVDDREKLAEYIKKVVWVSSNGNEQVTNMIGNLYYELGYPAISCEISKDGKMRSTITEGYKIDVSLTDKIYINNDNNSMLLDGADVIVFDHKITADTYTKILKPLKESSAIRGKHLVCIAPYYDEVALSSVISVELNAEYKKTKDVSLVLAVCSNINKYKRTNLSDLAVLLNTTVITSAMEREMISNIQSSDFTQLPFDMDNRGIPGYPIAINDGSGKFILKPFSKDLTDSYKDEILGHENYQDKIRVGYADHIEIGMNESIFSGFYYDMAILEKYRKIAEIEYQDAKHLCEINGVYSQDMINKQHRVFSLGLKTGVIEVGASSEITQGFLKDAVDDAVKAAASAYNNGIILGCNVTTLQALRNILYKNNGSLSIYRELDSELLTIFITGFNSVYSTIIANVYTDKSGETHITIDDDGRINTPLNQFDDKENKAKLNNRRLEYYMNYKNSINAIIGTSIDRNEVFDVTTSKFTKDIINSAETDKEIVKAVIDLLSLLITSNQLVIR